jgi:hypothetical protein
MEILIGITVWLTLGALHVPLYKHWWTMDLDYTVERRRYARWLILLGPVSLLASVTMVAPYLFKERTEDHIVISKRRTK